MTVHSDECLCVIQRKAAESCATLSKLGKPTILVSYWQYCNVISFCFKK